MKSLGVGHLLRHAATVVSLPGSSTAQRGPQTSCIAAHILARSHDAVGLSL